MHVAPDEQTKPSSQLEDSRTRTAGVAVSQVLRFQPEDHPSVRRFGHARPAIEIPDQRPKASVDQQVDRRTGRPARQAFGDQIRQSGKTGNAITLCQPRDLRLNDGIRLPSHIGNGRPVNKAE